MTNSLLSFVHDPYFNISKEEACLQDFLVKFEDIFLVTDNHEQMIELNLRSQFPVSIELSVIYIKSLLGRKILIAIY